jgi:predicted molibdopterin-dependent oxidoreductase YjgC
VDHQACILCDRCIRACDDVQSNEVIGRTGKGHAAAIAFDLDQPMGDSSCVSCGECAASCPPSPLPSPPGGEGEGEGDGQDVLFAASFPPASGRGKFVPCALAPAKELPDHEYPLVLNTGRLLEHWHTGTMTRRAAALDALPPGPLVEMHPADLARYGVTDGSEVTVRSRRGVIRLPARASDSVPPGSVFIPFHFREAAATSSMLPPGQHSSRPAPPRRGARRSTRRPGL